ncbi:MAG TPA: helix-turn-helix transcriptional regulator [Burkholderiaceae bacterium]|nr:helix-turn-helix transcriptional regulator [Burkholderiaceae bacterium]
MIHSSKSAEPPTSYLQLRQGIDLARLKRLDQEAPADPTRAVEPWVVAHSKSLGCSDLLVWEQQALTQEFYLPPNNCYDVYIRLAVSSPVVQWRDGVLDVRHDATDEVVVAPPFRAMYFRTFGPGQNLHLSLTPQLLMRAAGSDRPGPAVRLRNSFGERDPVIAGMGRVLLDYIKTPGERSRAFLESASTALAVRLLERYAEQRAPTGGKLSSAQLAKIDDYLHGHLDGRVSLQGMADLVGMSPYAFHRAFKAAHGIPPLRYSLQLRMRRARALVEGTRKPIGEIAAEVGFAELSHFSNTFRNHWGVAPSQLRQG